MKFIELFDDENDPESGIYKISFVKFPAIETNFIFFNDMKFIKPIDVKPPKKLTDTQKLIHPLYGWRFWKMDIAKPGDPMLLDNSHEFCKDHADKVYPIEFIRENFPRAAASKYNKGWMTQSNFCKDFKGIYNESFLMNNQLFNCRHTLTAIRDIKDVPPALLLSSHRIENFTFNFSVEDNEEQVVKGVALIPDKLIYRKVNGEEFYVYMSKDTIKKLKDKFGFNRTISLEHQEDSTGNAILLDSWLYPEKDDNCGVKNLTDGSWCLSYKIVNPTLWEMIKNKVVQGFSIEAVFDIK